jgi:hypothetical protein
VTRIKLKDSPFKPTEVRARQHPLGRRATSEIKYVWRARVVHSGGRRRKRGKKNAPPVPRSCHQHRNPSAVRSSL